MYNITYDNFKSWDDWVLSLDSYQIEDAKVIETYVHIPFSSNYVDLSEFNGSPSYKQRKFEASFTMIKNDRPLKARYSEIVNEIHGRKIKITDPRDTDYYYEGRVNVGEISYQNDTAHFTISATCNPYKLKHFKSVVTFEPPSALTTYELPNESMPTNPTITTTHDTQIVQGAKSWSVNAGTHRLAMVFKRGMNEIKLRSLVDYNLIPVANRQFEGWVPQDGATVSVTKCPLEVFEDGYVRNRLITFGKSFNNSPQSGTTQVIHKGRIARKLNSTAVNTASFLSVDDLTEGQTYTIFIDVCSDIPTTWNSNKIYINSNTSGIYTITPITTEWSTVSVTFTFVKVNNNYDHIHLYPLRPANNANNIYFSDLAIYIGTLTERPKYFKAWEDYTDSEKPAAYIETSGGTSGYKYLKSIILTSIEAHILTCKVKNVGDSTLIFSNSPKNPMAEILVNQFRDLKLSVETPTTNGQITPVFSAINSSVEKLKFYAYSPEVYATSKRNRVTIDYQEGAL